MKKIRCDMSSDFVYIDQDHDGAYLNYHDHGRERYICIGPAKIRKLRKQLKRALIAIEGDEAAHEYP